MPPRTESQQQPVSLSELQLHILHTIHLPSEKSHKVSEESHEIPHASCAGNVPSYAGISAILCRNQSSSTAPLLPSPGESCTGKNVSHHNCALLGVSSFGHEGNFEEIPWGFFLAFFPGERSEASVWSLAMCWRPIWGPIFSGLSTQPPCPPQVTTKFWHILLRECSGLKPTHPNGFEGINLSSRAAPTDPLGLFALAHRSQAATLRRGCL